MFQETSTVVRLLSSIEYGVTGVAKEMWPSGLFSVYDVFVGACHAR